jgi:hypothetical protein
MLAIVKRLRFSPLLIVMGVLCALCFISLAAASEAAERSSDGSQGQASCEGAACVLVTGNVNGKRLIVVDETDRILFIWSNTDQPCTDTVVKLGSNTGPVLPMTPQIDEAYHAIAKQIDWTVKGCVFQVAAR